MILNTTAQGRQLRGWRHHPIHATHQVGCPSPADSTPLRATLIDFTMAEAGGRPYTVDTLLPKTVFLS